MYRWYEWKEVLVSAAPAAVVIAAIFGAVFLFARAQCHGQWEVSGWRVNWGPVQGCLISKDGKHWLPSSAYREFDGDQN